MKNKLKIGYLSYYPPTYGGATKLAIRMASYLTEKGHDTHFIGYDTDINPKYLRERNIHLHKVKKIELPASRNQPYTWTLAGKLHRVHQKEKFDLIHVHYAVPYALSAFLAREYSRREGKDLPFIVTGHGTDIHTYGYEGDIHPMLKLALENANAITYVGEGLKERAEKPVKKGGLGIKKKGIHITNFVDTNQFYREKNSLRESLKLPEDVLVIGHASNFAPVKQTYHFFDLARELNKRGELDSVYFLMCGKGDDKDELQRRVGSFRIQDHFKFLGKLDPEKMRSAYSAMDVSILCSEKEGCPLAGLESMACEVPLIGTDVEGIKHIIKEDKTGFLFEPQDISALSKIIISLKKEKNKLKIMGKNSRLYAEKEHSVDAVMKKYLDLYFKVLN